AQGCVAVATDSGGQRDIIDDGVNGRLAAPGNAKGLADALAWALGDTAPSARDLRLSVEKFDAEKIARRYLELLEGLDSQTV
ncbi:MAG: glycosyltransferase, partial [Muribaculaceae bacterium]|nr:glycosyltransferase [Muribaculaceae bacterium]